MLEDPGMRSAGLRRVVVLAVLALAATACDVAPAGERMAPPVPAETPPVQVDVVDDGSGDDAEPRSEEVPADDAGTASPPEGADTAPSGETDQPADTTPDEAGAQEADTTSTTPFHTTTSGPEQVLTGDYASYVWTSDRFAGSWTRSVAGAHDRYLIELDQSAGGFDTDVVRHGHPVQRVDELDPGLTVAATIDVRLRTEGDGMWWAGPKFTVHDETTFQGFDGDYENYIVENASMSPEAFAERMFGGAQYLGETQQDGATYKHYLQSHGSGTWEQYWSVRQEFRDSGQVTVVPHLRKWRDSGMANEFVLIQKPANVETYGPMSGEVEITDPSYRP